MNHIRLITSTGLACCLFLIGTGWVHAQREVRERERSDVRVRRISAVIGAGVRLADNVRYGEVKDFVFNDNGCIDYVVIAYEDDYVLVPWGVADFDFDRRIVSIDIGRDKLRELTFTRDRWPDLSDSRFTRRMRTVFGDKAERREPRGGRDVERNNRDVERKNEPPRDREPARDNPPRTNRDQPPSRDRQPPADRPTRDQKPGTERRDNGPPRDKGEPPRKPQDDKKRDRPDRS